MLPNEIVSVIEIIRALNQLEVQVNLIGTNIQHMSNNQAQRYHTIMVTLADIQTALGAAETQEAALIALLQASVASNTQLSTDLAAALAANDPAAIQSVVDKLNADTATMQAAVAAATPTPPTPPTPAP